MIADDVVQFLTALGCNKIRVGHTGWVKATCPLYWEHGGNDKNPSFAMSADTGPFICKCHGCGYSGSPQALVMKIGMTTGRDVSRLYHAIPKRELPSAETMLERLKAAEYGSKAAKLAGISVPLAVKNAALQYTEGAEDEPLAPSILDELFDPLPRDVMDYLRGNDTERGERRLTDDTIADFGLRWHTAAQRICIPIWDCEGQLRALTGHNYAGGYGPKYKHSAGFQKSHYLYAEHMVDRGKRGYLVEGFYDVMMLTQQGYTNTVALMGSSLSALQVEKLVMFFDELVIVPDGDEPGKAAVAGYLRMIAGRLPTTVVATPNGIDPGDFPLVLSRELLGDPFAGA